MLGLVKKTTGLIGAIGALLALVENLSHFDTMVERNFYLCTIIFWLMLVVGTWPSKETQHIRATSSYRKGFGARVRSFKWVILVSLLMLIIVGYRQYTIARVEKGAPIIIDPNRDRIPPPKSQLFATATVSAQSRNSDVKILQFALNPDKTLYVNTGGTYQLDRQLSDQILSGRCTNEFRATEALKSLREFASNRRVSALKYIQNEEQ